MFHTQGLAIRGVDAAAWQENVDIAAFKIQKVWSAARRRWRDTKASPNPQWQACKELFKYWDTAAESQPAVGGQVHDLCTSFLTGDSQPDADSSDADSVSSHGTLSQETLLLPGTGESSDSSSLELDERMFAGWMADAQPHDFDQDSQLEAGAGYDFHM